MSLGVKNERNPKITTVSQQTVLIEAEFGSTLLLLFAEPMETSGNTFFHKLYCLKNRESIKLVFTFHNMLISIIENLPSCRYVTLELMKSRLCGSLLDLDLVSISYSFLPKYRYPANIDHPKRMEDIK